MPGHWRQPRPEPLCFQVVHLYLHTRCLFVTFLWSNISGTPGGNFIRSGTNVQVDWWMKWLEYEVNLSGTSKITFYKTTTICYLTNIKPESFATTCFFSRNSSVYGLKWIMYNLPPQKHLKIMSSKPKTGVSIWVFLHGESDLSLPVLIKTKNGQIKTAFF